MSTPKTTKFTLKRIVENLGNIPDKGFGKETPKLTPEQKKKLVEYASMFENFGDALKNEETILNSARALTELCELAETYALNECGDWFQQDIVRRDMKELKKRVMEYNKIAKEAYARNQQLGVAYQDIGHILGRYYDLKKNKGVDQKFSEPGTQAVMEGHRFCAWCKKMMQKDATTGERDTHGICADCLEKMKAEMPGHRTLSPIGSDDIPPRKS